MAHQARVAWTEGMALDPHHFQQWDRHHASVAQSRWQATAPHAWGVAELLIDEDAAANGMIRVVRCRGVTADGLVLDIPDADAAPAPRAVGAHFPPTADAVLVSVAVPAERVRGLNVLLPDSGTQRETRFLVERLAVVDDTTGQDEREIEVARPNVSLRFGTEPVESYSLLPIAELQRAPSGALRLNDRFVPPCLAVSASAALRATARRALELLVARSGALWERTRRLPRGQAPLSGADVVSLWLQSTVNAYIPALQQHVAPGTAHPEALFATLASLAGQLSAMPGNAEVDPRALPTYDHRASGPAFAALERAIVRLLAAEIGDNYTVIPLARQGDVQVGTIADELLANGTTFYLIGSGVAGGAERTIPDQIRVAAPTVMPNVLSGFLRALPLEWEPRPPAGVPAGPELHHFRLANSGQFWDDIRSTRAIGVYVPTHLDGLRVQLIAIRAAA